MVPGCRADDPELRRALPPQVVAIALLARPSLTMVVSPCGRYASREAADCLEAPVGRGSSCALLKLMRHVDRSW